MYAYIMTIGYSYGPTENKPISATITNKGTGFEDSHGKQIIEETYYWREQNCLGSKPPEYSFDLIATHLTVTD
jgi:hypothetical protein